MSKLLFLCAFLFLEVATSSVASQAPEQPKDLTTPEEIVEAASLCIARLSADGINPEDLKLKGWVGGPLPKNKGSYVYTKGKVLLATVTPAPMQPSMCIVAGGVLIGQEKTVSETISKLFPSAKQLAPTKGWKQALQLDDYRFLVVANNRTNPKPDDIDNGGVMLTTFYADGHLREVLSSEMKDIIQ